MLERIFGPLELFFTSYSQAPHPSKEKRSPKFASKLHRKNRRPSARAAREFQTRSSAQFSSVCRKTATIDIVTWRNSLTRWPRLARREPTCPSTGSCASSKVRGQHRVFNSSLWLPARPREPRRRRKPPGRKPPPGFGQIGCSPWRGCPPLPSLALQQSLRSFVHQVSKQPPQRQQLNPQ